MASKHVRRNRRNNVAVPFNFEQFIQRLTRATGWTGEVVAERPYSPDRFIAGRWCGDSPGEFSVNYLFEEMFSKFDDGKPSPDKEAKTWQRFAEAEEMSRDTNIRLIYDKSRFSVDPRSVESLIERARRKISEIVGDFDWNRASRGFAFGPGASTRLPRAKGDAAYKFSGIPETTIGNLALATAAIKAVPLWEESILFEELAPGPKVVPGNKIGTVPKNYKTHRVTATEPCMNMYVQKGIGGLIRQRLKRHGVNLDDQTRNQELARKGVDLNLATIDLSMASDTVSYELVRRLMPSDWFEALEQCRSPIGVLPSGEQVLYRKFSSMGNGYTFELESLIFFGLCLALAEVYGLEVTNIAVYGDDIIFPASHAPELCELLKYAGFKPNEDKTHLTGPFRESCGKHYYSGYDVTPFYIKRRPKSLRDKFLLHNQVYRWCKRNWWNSRWHRGEMRSLLEDLRASCPSFWRKPRIPDDFGDGAFIGTFDQVCPEPALHGHEGWICEVLTDVSQSGDLETLGRLIKSLFRLDQLRGDLRFLEEPLSAGGVSLPPEVQRRRVVVRRDRKSVV